MRLLCLAHAGAGASVFRSWAAVAPCGLEISAISQPGREGRYTEPLLRDVGALVQDIVRLECSTFERPYALLGHSMGALIAFELARALRAAGGPAPRRLFVSAFRAPHLPEWRAPLHGLPEALLKAELQRLQGTPSEILADPEMMQTLLPALRADLESVERYQHRVEPPLLCPITCLGGVTDDRVGRLELGAWRRHTTNEFRLRLFPGAHFYLYRTPALVLRAVAADLGIESKAPQVSEARAMLGGV